jgi:hypothetical protein
MRLVVILRKPESRVVGLEVAGLLAALVPIGPACGRPARCTLVLLSQE